MGIILIGLMGAFADAPPTGVLSEASEAHPRQSEGDVEVLRDGRLLAVYTDFYGGREDEAPACIAGRLSADEGATWSEPFVVVENTGANNVMSASLLRLADGRLMLGYLKKNGPADCQPFVRTADSHDLTFGPETCVTDEPAYYVMNNDRLVQLPTGRIVAPLSFSAGLLGDGHFRIVCFYSDDGGATWQRGKGIVDEPMRGAMEPGIVELRDGTALIIIRTQLGRIDRAISTDACDTWGPVEPLGVAAPEAPATIARMPSGPLLLVYNPTVKLGSDHSGPRTPLRCSVSLDEGLTWSPGKDLETDAGCGFAYTSVTFVGETAVMTYYCEHGRGGMVSQKVALVPVEWFLN